MRSGLVLAAWVMAVLALTTLGFIGHAAMAAPQTPAALLPSPTPSAIGAPSPIAGPNSASVAGSIPSYPGPNGAQLENTVAMLGLAGLVLLAGGFALWKLASVPYE